MEWLQGLIAFFGGHLPLVVVLAVSAGLLAVAQAVFRLRARRSARGDRAPLVEQVVMLGLTGLGIVAVVLALPVGDTLKGQLLGLLGLAFTAVIAFSSTTFVANAMAGLMVRAVRNFRPGDWVGVGQEFGRVTERGLFHTEIQTEDRDLVTLPNLYLVTNPVKVIHSSGTIVSATVSLGYGVDRRRIEGLLAAAAEEAGLQDPFVQILELGDFSVSYRVAGFLDEVRHLLSARSALRGAVIDALHGDGVEIVSPTFMVQRRQEAEAGVLPPQRVPEERTEDEPLPEERIFDKAEEKSSLEELRSEREELVARLAELEKSAPEDEGGRRRAEAEVERIRARIDAITGDLEAGEQEAKAEAG
jgi:small-conductance mechanosensitive channel